MEQNIQFNLPKNNSNYIKVIGVGGGGCNAVNFMYDEGIKGVDYVVCNTDAQALENSPISNKIQLGITLTEGLGAGANPDVGEKAALESIEQIRSTLEGNTQMVFITAGMGGGTGTGAVPVIAKQAKDLGILTVAIVTTPFTYEGLKRSRQAQAGIKKLRECVDSLIVINNNKISEIYEDLTVEEGYGKANEILLKGAKGMAEVISKHYLVNIDLRDARTVLENGGTAIMGSAVAEGDTRAYEAVSAALNSPLLNDNKITGAKNALLLITYGDREATQREMNIITGVIQEQAGENMADLIFGVGKDESLGESISVVVIATGFDADQQQEIVNAETKKIIHTLEENQTATRDLTEPKTVVVNTSSVNNSYPQPAIPEIKKEISLSDMFNIWTDCEVVTADDTFVIVDKTAVVNNLYREPEVRKEVQTQSQPQFRQEQAPIVHRLSEDTYDNRQRDHRRVPIENERGEIRHTLSIEEYSEFEKVLTDAKPTSYIEDRSNRGNEFTIYTKEENDVSEPVQMRMFEDEPDEILNPIDCRISDVMSKRSNRLQDYNYKFGNNQSRTSLGKDSAGEIQIRRNNSVLHDNVD